jgi:hypothetical protein
METRTYQVFKFSELSKQGKERAKADYAADIGYSWADEALASIEALAAHFGGKVSRYSIDWFDSSPSSMSFDMPEMEKDEIERRLRELGDFNAKTLKGSGDCVLTGVCHDEDAIDGFRIAFMRNGETDLNALMRAAFDSWLNICQSDCEYQYKNKEFSEHCDANGYMFTANGEMD